MKRLAICLVAVGALGGLLATPSGAKAKKKCANKHEKSGCVLGAGATYQANGAGQVVGVIARPRGFNLQLRGQFCASGFGPIPESPTLKIGKLVSFGGAAISGSIKVTARSGTLTLRTHRDAIPPNPNLGPSNQGSPACNTNQTFTLKRVS